MTPTKLGDASCVCVESTSGNLGDTPLDGPVTSPEAFGSSFAWAAPVPGKLGDVPSVLAGIDAGNS